jgi:hypothetical protein
MTSDKHASPERIESEDKSANQGTFSCPMQDRVIVSHDDPEK